jgi:putative nucleotidyltransferase with HDIG domain
MAVLAPAGLALAFFALQAGLVSSELAAAEGLYCAATAAGLLLGSIVGREEDLNAHRRRLDEVLECTAGFAAGSDPGSTVLQALKTAVEELGASAGYVMLTGPDGQGDLQTEAAYSPDGEFRFPRTLEIGRGVTGQAVKSRRPVRTRNSGDARLSSEVPGESAKTAVSVPLIVRIRRTGGSSPTECVLGALTLVERDQARPFEAEEVRFLRGLAALVSASVAANQMEQLRQTTFLNTLETLAYSLEARDPYTSGHSQRTSVVSLMIAEALGFDADALEELRVGTILHDIGKIGVPDAVLQKPGKLAPEELAAMRKHAIVGYDICKPLGLSEGVLMIVRNHHERLDGTGYPDGLRGGELPLSLRIVCVADAFDAMSSRRPYRDVMELAKVQAELSRGAGTQFDPLVVEALRELIPTPRLQALYGEQWGNDLGRAA